MNARHRIANFSDLDAAREEQNLEDDRFAARVVHDSLDRIPDTRSQNSHGNHEQKQ